MMIEPERSEGVSLIPFAKGLGVVHHRPSPSETHDVCPMDIGTDYTWHGERSEPDIVLLLPWGGWVGIARQGERAGYRLPAYFPAIRNAFMHSTWLRGAFGEVGIRLFIAYQPFYPLVALQKPARPPEKVVSLRGLASRAGSAPGSRVPEKGQVVPLSGLRCHRQSAPSCSRTRGLLYLQRYTCSVIPAALY